MDEWILPSGGFASRRVCYLRGCPVWFRRRAAPVKNHTEHCYVTRKSLYDHGQESGLEWPLEAVKVGYYCSCKVQCNVHGNKTRQWRNWHMLLEQLAN